MSGWREVRARWRVGRGGSSADGELDEELRFHLEQETDRLLRAGVAPAEARRQARLALGGYDRIVEETRDARGTAWLENVWRDLRFAGRGLARNAGFTAAVVVTLAVGIGATSAVFALANALLLRPIPGVRAPDELVVVQLSPEPGLVTGISHANIEDLRAGAPSLTGLVGSASRTMQAQGAGGGAFEVEAEIVQGDYFGVLGVRPRQGRWFTAAERAPGAAGDVVVISDRFRMTRLGGATDVVGTVLQLNAGTYTIVGVAPAGFHGTVRTRQTDLWLPPDAYGRMWHRPVDAADRRASIFYELVGRLAADATPAQVEQQLRATMAALVERYPEINEQYASYVPTVHAGIGLPVSVRERTARTLRLLLGVVSVLLLIACANVANLLLFRGVARQGETAVRRALGASAARLVQQHLAEGLLLALVGGAAGVALAVGLGAVVRGQALFGLPAIESLVVDWRVVGFALGSALLTGALFTLTPALVMLRGRGADPGRASARTTTAAGGALRGGLMVVQIAASLALLVGALLLVRTVQNLGEVPLGYDAEAVLAFGYNPAPQGYDVATAGALRQRLLEEVGRIPGIERASVASFPPVGDRLLYMLAVPGSGADPLPTLSAEVSADYFATVGTRIVAGRGFSAAEQHAAFADGGPIVISETAARALFGAADPVGRVLDVRGFTGSRQQIVVGVSEDVRGSPRQAEVRPSAYLPLGTATLQHGYILVRSHLARAETERAIGESLARIDAAIPFFAAESLGDAVRRAIAEDRLLARLLTLFAALAVGLAGVGLYGVIAYAVARRRREIGVRIALGARGGEVVRLVAEQSLRFVLAGLAIGLPAGFALSRALASRVFGVTPLDPLTYGAAVIGFMAVAALASALPAHAAARVDPMDTLRQE